MIVLDNTGERFIPESNDYELELEHIERYFAASRLVTGKNVLDAACGEGYGSSILASSANTVIGIDIDETTVNHAKEKYGLQNNLSFYQGSIDNLSMIQNNSIDVVVSFETIEHVPEDVQLAFLAEISRVLTPNGFLIMSSPNKAEYSDRYNFHNQFHIHELYFEEFQQLIGTYFKNAVYYQQYLEVASFIDRSDIDESNVCYHKERDKYNPIGKYIIAVASNGILPRESLSIASMHLKPVYLPTLDELNYCRAEAIKCRSLLKQNEEEIAKYQLVQDNLTTKAAELSNSLKLAIEELDRRAEELNHRQQVINNSNKQNDALRNELNLAKEELDRRAIELANRQDVINHCNQSKENLANDLKLAKEELSRRGIELDNRQKLINQCNQDIAVLSNDLKLAKEELSRKENELDNRQALINEKDLQIQQLEEEMKKKWYHVFKRSK